MSSKSILNK